MRDFRRFPQWQLPAACVDSAALQMPVWFMQSLFGASIVGQYAVMNRALVVPLALVGTSFGDVFRQRSAAEWHEHGHCQNAFADFGRVLALAAIVPTAALLIAGPAMFAFVFGEDWRTAGEFARIMAVLFALRFAVSPLTYVILLAQRQRLNLVIQGMFLAGATMAWWWGERTGSPVAALTVYAGAHAVTYVVYLGVCGSLRVRRMP